MHGTVSRMYDVFMVIVYILRLFFILYGNTASHLDESSSRIDDVLFIFNGKSWSICSSGEIGAPRDFPWSTYTPSLENA